jgi:nucleotide-binding universal stress UspA family protein
MIQIAKIMIPTDFSEYSRHALRYAITLAESFKAKLYLMHAWELAVLVTQQSEAYTALNMADTRAGEEEALKRLTEEVRGRGIDAEPVFSSGRAYSEIVRAAQQLEVDLIVIATHGRKGLSHLVFGSTAERVVRLAPCPVLTVKHPEHDFVK